MAKELIYRVKFDFDASSASQGGQAIERSQQDAQESVNETTAAIRRQQEAQEQTSRSTRNFSKAQSNANQTLFTFGDLLNDSQQFQFGFAQGTRAIGNNIGFAAEQFSQIQQRTGGFKSALSALGSSLLGPGGLILAINAGVTALTVFGDTLFGDEDSVSEKAKKTKEELADLRKEMDLFSPQLDVITELQKEIFPDQSDINRLQQQVQFSRQIEASLRQQRDELQPRINQLENQLDVLERIDNKQLGVNEAIRRGLISREVGQGILQGTIDLEGTIISKQNELNSLEERSSALNTSINQAQKDQINTLAEIEGRQAAINSQLFQGLQALRNRRDEFETTVDRVGLDQRGSLVSQLLPASEVEQQADMISTTVDELSSQTVQLGEKYKDAQGNIFSASEVALGALEDQTLSAEDTLNRVTVVADAASRAVSALFGESKAAAIASAIINGAQAITKTFAEYGPTPVGFALASTMAATTAAQIAKIESTEPGSEGSAGGGEGGTGPRIGGASVGGRNRLETDPSRKLPGFGREQRDQVQVQVINTFDERTAARVVQNGQSQLDNERQQIPNQ